MERRLDKGGLVTLGASDRTVVVARGGRYWLTRRGDAEDYFLEAGEALALRRGPWLVEALEEGMVTWNEVPQAQKPSFGGVWREADRLPAFPGV